jgi:hypothetical protein
MHIVDYLVFESLDILVITIDMMLISCVCLDLCCSGVAAINDETRRAAKRVLIPTPFHRSEPTRNRKEVKHSRLIMSPLLTVS